MAKAKKLPVPAPVEVPFVELTLTQKEALVLMAVMDRIGGVDASSPRGETDKINAALRSALRLSGPELRELEAISNLVKDGDSQIMFKNYPF
jgi:hypothetical protein